MFNFECEVNWKNNLKDKMVTFIDLYRKQYNEVIKDIKYKREYHEEFRMVITYIFENVEITFESVETDDTNWIAISIEIDSDDKQYFNDKYKFIKKAIKGIK